MRHTRTAVNLDGFVDDLTGADRHHCLDGAHPYASLSVSEFVHCLGGREHHATHRLNFDTSLRNDLWVLAEVCDALSECFASDATLHHELESLFGCTN